MTLVGSQVLYHMGCDANVCMLGLIYQFFAYVSIED